MIGKEALSLGEPDADAKRHPLEDVLPFEDEMARRATEQNSTTSGLVPKALEIFLDMPEATQENAARMENNVLREEAIEKDSQNTFLESAREQLASDKSTFQARLITLKEQFQAYIGLISNPAINSLEISRALTEISESRASLSSAIEQFEGANENFADIVYSTFKEELITKEERDIYLAEIERNIEEMATGRDAIKKADLLNEQQKSFMKQLGGIGTDRATKPDFAQADSNTDRPSSAGGLEPFL